MATCPQCAAENSPKSRFCTGCGGALPAPAPAGETTVPLPLPTVVVPEPASVPAPEPIERTERIPALAEAETKATGPGSASVPAPGLIPAGAEDDACPLRLSVHFHRVLVAGHVSTCWIEVENQGVIPLEGIEITFDSRALEQPARKRLARLPVGPPQRHLVEIDPQRPGHFILQAGVVFDLGGQRTAYQGTRPLRVNAAPDNANIHINIGDIQSNSGGAANQGLGAEYGTVQISNLVSAGAIKTLNDLLDLELPGDFQPLPLELDYQLSVRAVVVAAAADSRTRPLEIPRSFLGFAQSGTTLTLQPAAEERLPVALVARPEFRLGRSRQECDWVAWFWPRTPQNDDRTRRISKLHARLEARPGGALLLRDGEAANGTSLDGGTVPAEGTTFETRGLIGLGGEYVVEAHHFPAAHPGEPAVANLRSWAGAASSGTPVTAQGAVRFLPQGTGTAVRDAVWLLTDAAFGSSRSNPVVIEGSGVAEIHGRFHHFRGGFWIQVLDSAAVLRVNGHAVRTGDIVPLVTGMELEIGADRWRTEVA